MEGDFVIRPVENGWRAFATSDAGKSFAAGDERFEGSEAALTPSGATAMFTELSERGMLVRLPDGSPASRGRPLLFRLMLALLILVPGLLFLNFLLQ